MKVQVLQDDLNKAISICSRFASSRVQLPVLANILLEADNNKLRVCSTNLEVSVSISLGAKVTEKGSITVPSKVITDIVSNLKSGTIDLVSEKEVLSIKSSEFESNVSGMNASDFPVTPQDVGAESIKFPFDGFKNSLSRVLFSVSNDETRPVLTGVLMILKVGEVVLVSTDGFRLSQKKIKIAGNTTEKKIIIPKNTLAELSRITGSTEFEFSVKKADNQIVLGIANVVMASRIIDGEFPDFEKIIPKTTKFKILVDKEELLRCIKLASVFAKDSANVVKFLISEKTLEVTAESNQSGTQKGKVDIKLTGSVEGKFEIAFNYRFLEEFLNAVDSEEIQIEFSDPNSPVLFLDLKDTDYLHIIMPVRLQS